MPVTSEEIALRSVRALERRSGCRVSFHDYTGLLIARLPHDLRGHVHQPCVAAKTCDSQRCKGFDLDRCRSELERRADGFWKLCHVGVLECCVPLRDDRRLLGACFVGLFRWGGSALPVGLVHEAGAPLRIDAADALPPLGTQQDLDDVAELARMLAERVLRLLRSSQGDSLQARRRERILVYLGHHFAHGVELADVARHLSLSPSRSGKIVRELFGCTWPQLVTRYRVERACALLEATDMGATAIAERCGFADSAYFHRVFRRVLGCTPGEWRKRRL